MRTQYLNSLPEHWQPSAAVYAALGDATRQKILLLFEAGEELSIKEIAACFSLGRTTIVYHLSALESAGILTVRRQGKLALYRINYEIVLEALENLRLLINEDLDLLREKQTGGNAACSS